MRHRLPLLLLPALAGAVPPVPLEIPRIADPRLEISLYAESPRIVTPAGAAVDARGRLFVIESHTHLRPPGYPGPRYDLIKIFAGVDDAGRARTTQVFADDLDAAMNLAFSPDGTLFACTAKTIFALPDRDGDDRCDGKVPILQIDSEQTYPHNQLLALAFSPDGWLYVSRGNMGAFPYAWVTPDGRRWEGVGEGGEVVRIRPDGSGFERFATGFWNAFDLKFDRYGRLLLVDNDPDSRGPNKLVELIAGGDYGYRALYGGSGLHPYQAWDGDLPGTLPYAAGLGEAPSGVMDTLFAALPRDYGYSALATIWGSHQVSLVRLRPHGTSLRGQTETFIQGGEYFRPVAVQAAPDGTIFITDWVLKDYPNHGQGRIWRVTPKPGTEVATPLARFHTLGPAPGAEKLEYLQRAGRDQLHLLRDALTDADPFVLSTAISSLARSEFHWFARENLENSNPQVRLGALLALRRGGYEDAAAILPARLRDSDPIVRQMALVWTGERRLKALTQAVDEAGSFAGLTPRLFETWLATLQILALDAEAGPPRRTRPVRIVGSLSPEFVVALVRDESRPSILRGLAIRHLDEPESPEVRRLLFGLAASGDPHLRLEAIRSLARSWAEDAAAPLWDIVLDRAQPGEVRAEALLALGPGAGDALADLLWDSAEEVRLQAARSARFALTAAVRAQAERILRIGSPTALERRLQADLAFALQRGESRDQPESVEAWKERLAAGGDPVAGRRVFFSPIAMCSQCHRLDGRGGMIGPDLSAIGASKSRAELIQSLVRPADDISPEYQGWEIRTTTGEVITGLQGHLRTGGGATIIALDGKERRVQAPELVHLKPIEMSLMPDGLVSLLSSEEIRDLVAYLSLLK